MTYPLPDIAARFAGGKTYEQYLAHMQKNRPTLDAMTQVAQVSADDERFFRSLEPTRALVVSEDWCPDCALNVPVLMRLASVNPAIEVRFVGREDNYDILAYCLKEGRKAIPTFVFFDAQWNEIGHWVERPAQADALLAEWDRLHAPPQEPDRTADVWRDHRHARSEYRDGLFFAGGLWRETIVELRLILSREVFSNVKEAAAALA